MVNFEQVKLLEAKVVKAIEHIERINREKNALLQQETELKDRVVSYQRQEAELKSRLESYKRQETELQAKLESYQRQETELQAKLESYQTRIDELEVLVTRFKEDQGKIEESILSALDRLNQFEKDIEKSLKEKPDDKPAVPTRQAEEGLGEEADTPNKDISELENDSGFDDDAEEPIIDEESWNDIPDPLVDTPDQEQPDGARDGELDIF